MKNLRLTLPGLLMLLLLTTNNLNAWQSPAPNESILSLIRSFEVEGCSILEVSKEMFEILAADDRSNKDLKETISKIDHLIYLNCFTALSGKEKKIESIADKFVDKADLNNFKLLMRSQDSFSTNLFYRRQNGQLNEYLLVTDFSIQYISTSLNIMSIKDLKDIIDMAGDAGDL